MLKYFISGENAAPFLYFKSIWLSHSHSHHRNFVWSYKKYRIKIFQAPRESEEMRMKMALEIQKARDAAINGEEATQSGPREAVKEAKQEIKFHFKRF